MQKIFLVEDDEIIAKSISNYLETWGMEVVCAKDFEKITEEFVLHQPHLVLLDITLPYFNGYHWCTQLRKISKAPIVFLSANSDNMNIVLAMNMGGDDFIAKPFDLNVLYAKIQAVLRRSYDFGTTTSILEHRGVVLNTSEMSIHYMDEKLDLTKNEYRILQILMENKGKVVSREEIMERLWESESFIDDNTLTVNVTRLRRKLEEAGIEGFISTKKGVGYLIEL